MVRRSLNDLTADNGYGLMFGLGVLLVVAGAALIAAGRDGSALVWMGGLLIALGAFGYRLASFKLGPSGAEVTLNAEAIQSALDTVKAELVAAPSEERGRSHVSPAPAGAGSARSGSPAAGMRLSVPIAGSYWSDEVVRQATLAAGSNSATEFGAALARLVSTAREPGSIYVEAGEHTLLPDESDRKEQ